MTPEQAALQLAEEYGLPVFPCRSRSETINGKRYNAKSPYTRHGFMDASTNLEQITGWWNRYPDALVGVPTGERSRLFLVDIDPDGVAWYRTNEERLSCARVHRTQRGHHLLYRMPSIALGNTAGLIARGIDTRGDGGFLVWWPAHGFDAVGSLEDLTEPPDWLIQHLATAKRSKSNGTCGAKFTEGERHRALLSQASKLRRADLSGDVLEAALLRWNDEHCDPPQDESDVQRIARDYSQKPRLPLSEHDSEGHSEPRPYLLLPVDELLTARAPPQYLIEGLIEAQTAVGVVAPPESGKSLLVAHWAACVATGQPFHGRRCARGLVVYLCGEGQAGAARRMQAIESKFALRLSGAPLVVSKAAASLIDPGEIARIRRAIDQAQERYQLPLALLITDTLARFITPGDESKAQDMNAFLAAVDTLRGSASAVTCHHPGHQDATRGRGSSGWKAALDSEYTLYKEGDVVTVTCQKMKDGEKPAPFSLRIEPASTYMAREDGSLVQSVVLVPTDTLATRSVPNGKNQKRLLAELERLATLCDALPVWPEGQLRGIGRGLGMHKNSARDAVLGLRNLGYLKATVGGSTLAHLLEKGTDGTNRTESTESSRDTGNEKDDVPLGTSLSSCPSISSSQIDLRGSAP